MKDQDKDNKPEWLDGQVEWLERLKKGEKQKPTEKPIEKKWFEIKVEGIVPITITYRVFTEDEDKAFEEYMQGKATLLEKPRLDLRQIKRRRVSIRNITSALFNWVKKFY